MVEKYRNLFNKYKALPHKFEFRTIRQDEIQQTAHIEQVCFKPKDACTYEDMEARIMKAPELFLVATDKSTGKIAGFINGLATNETRFRDDFFKDASLYNPNGKNIMLLGLAVLPEYREQGLATVLMQLYKEIESEKKRDRLILTCSQQNVGMYEKMGFYDAGLSDSDWGGDKWHEMICCLTSK